MSGLVRRWPFKRRLGTRSTLMTNPWCGTKAATLAMLLAIVVNQGAVGSTGQSSYSPNLTATRTQLYWGDLHLHTALSADSYTMGARTTPEMAYRFARGEPVTAGNGMALKARYPLDFLAITDHAEYLSIYALLDAEDPRLAGWKVGDAWRELLRQGKMGELTMAFSDAFQNPTPEKMAPPEVVAGAWRDVVATADRFNQPHQFTTLPGYEWTSTLSGDNLHRVVIYREGLGYADRLTPFTSQDSKDPEALWAALARYYDETGGNLLAIPHNSNVSNGRLFSPVRHNGEPFDTDYMAMRRRWEPLLEVSQVKGDSETHPQVSPTDRYADFERWDEGNIQLTQPKEPWMFAQEYARPVLQQGLAYRAQSGINPFEFGMLGSSDSHTGFSAVAEDNFFGKFRSSEPSAERMFSKMADVLNENWRLVASGLTAVWAKENTREAIFDALRRREVYATTGSRIALRFFAGWEFTEQDLRDLPASETGYQKGVPMGSVLSAPRDANDLPSFMLIAMKEPDGPDLHALQVVKGWIDAQGHRRETIYDVALAGSEETAGSPVLSAVWRDADFDAGIDAVYYARVIEVPRPRWTAKDGEFFGIEPPPAAPATIQDRAYSSPIWYYHDVAAQ